LLVAALLLSSLSSASAETLTVNSSADSGGTCPGLTCTLRQAILTANPGDTITFSNGITNITLTSVELYVDKDVSINGPGANQLVIQRSTENGALNIRVFNIAFSAHVSISGLTVADGILASGGGIGNRGTLTLTECMISRNIGDSGGGIHNFTGGSLNIVDTTIYDNSTGSNGAGSGIYNSQGGTVVITNSTISGNDAGNQGGGIYNLGTVTVTNSTVFNNNAVSPDGGGGIYSVSGAAVNARNTIIARNTASGGSSDFKGSLSSQGYNFIGANTASLTITGDTTGNQFGDPKLGSLQDNGGSTLTHAPHPDSKALDTGSSSGFPTDQRGFPRPVDNPSITNVSGGDGSDIGAFETQASTPTPSPTPKPATLGNISTRLRIGTGDRVMIAGFIIQGSAPKKVLIRGIGPSLAAFGISNAITNPRLELYDSTETIGRNDNWQATQLGGVITSNQAEEIQNLGFAPNNSSESALIATVPPGKYTAILQGVNDATGVGLVEVYDLNTTSGSLLANISTRGFVESADNVMIGGFIVVTKPTKVIIRAIGPSLTQFHVPDALANPQLELHDGSAIIARNNDWQTTQIGGLITTDQAVDIQNSQLAPTHSAESAIILTLQPGSYTAVVRGFNDTSGNALVEVYSLE
jgi:hypothetical protein